MTLGFFITVYLIIGLCLATFWTCRWGNPGLETFLAAIIGWPLFLILAAVGM